MPEISAATPALSPGRRSIPSLTPENQAGDAELPGPTSTRGYRHRRTGAHTVGMVVLAGPIGVRRWAEEEVAGCHSDQGDRRIDESIWSPPAATSLGERPMTMRYETIP